VVEVVAVVTVVVLVPVVVLVVVGGDGSLKVNVAENTSVGPVLVVSVHTPSVLPPLLPVLPSATRFLKQVCSTGSWPSVSTTPSLRFMQRGAYGRIHG
jgi:hypothetical protein